MSVQFFGSQIGGETDEPLSYTGSPWKLFTSDILLFGRWSPYLINIVWPIWPWPSNELDELYPSLANVFDITLHSILFVTQGAFLISLPFLLTVPFCIYVAYVAAFIALNTVVCKLLNGKIPAGGLKSTENDQSRAWAPHDDESWIFLNGVAVGYFSTPHAQRDTTRSIAKRLTGNTGCNPTLIEYQGPFTVPLQAYTTKRTAPLPPRHIRPISLTKQAEKG
jgi:hypothetical protein